MKNSGVKAFTVYDKERKPRYATIIFAVDRNEARKLAKETYACDGSKTKNIYVYRSPEMDNTYRGEFKLDWNDPRDRKQMCIDGFYCSSDVKKPECTACTGREYCLRYAGKI